MASEVYSEEKNKEGCVKTMKIFQTTNFTNYTNL